jgi:hypothetical protein
VDGEPRRRHVASIGSVAIEADEATSVRDRVQLWKALHLRIGALQLGHEVAGRLMGALHARIPMPTPEETGSVERWHAESDLTWWSGMHRCTDDSIADLEGLKKLTQEKIDGLKAESGRHAEMVDDAKAKVARLANYPKLG